MRRFVLLMVGLSPFVIGTVRLAQVAAAQQPEAPIAKGLVQSQHAPRPEDLGTVTGHITCADTQRPARFAAVSLIAARVTSDSPESLSPFNLAAISTVHTDLTGAYTITNVPPGQYYLRVDLYGYATPLSQFTAAELKAPTPGIEERIQRELQLINVTPNSALVADVTLRRSGSITGRIMYDDGSPVITTGIAFARRDTNGKFGDVVPIGYVTGSHGEYEIVSLSPGEYIVRVTLDAIEQHMESVIDADGKTRNKLVETSVLSLPIYSGNAFRSKDAAIIKVEDGQETTDINITIPISRLHEVSGTLLAKDGHAINDGKVELLYSDTHEELESVSAREDGTFRLPYVPEGNYIIAVTNASDKTQIEIPNSTDPAAVTRLYNKTLHTYNAFEQPLTIQTDIQSLYLTLPDKPATTTPPNTSSDNN